MQVNMDEFLKQFTGSRAAEACLLHLFHYGETYGRAVCAEFPVSLVGVQKQLDKLERCGVVVSKSAGRTRMFSWNPKSPFTPALKALVAIQYEAIPLSRRQEIFSRRRPRRADKPVVRHQR